MEFVKEILLVYGRIVTILPLLLFMTLFLMGKRSIGELPVFDFLVIITLGSVVGADIADPHIEHIHTAFAIVGIAMLQRLISFFIIRSRKIGKLLTFEPTIVIKDGIFLVKNMKKIQFSIDNILQMLREKDVFDVSVVHLGIIETNGKLSVYKNSDKLPLLREDIGLEKTEGKFHYPIIIEGNIESNTLTTLGKDESWLLEQLKTKGFNLKDIFYASLTSDYQLHISPFNDKKPTYIKH